MLFFSFLGCLLEFITLSIAKLRFLLVIIISYLLALMILLRIALDFLLTLAFCFLLVLIALFAIVFFFFGINCLLVIIFDLLLAL